MVTQQCSIPVFDGLVPGPLNAIILKLLYCNARWHALAKLRMQTAATIHLLEETTEQLGDQFREFVVATKEVETFETQREAEKRERDARRKEAEKEAKEVKKRAKEIEKKEKKEKEAEKKREKDAQKKAKADQKRGKGTTTKAKGRTKEASTASPANVSGISTFRVVQPAPTREGPTSIAGKSMALPEHNASASRQSQVVFPSGAVNPANHHPEPSVSWTQPTSVETLESDPNFKASPSNLDQSPSGQHDRAAIEQAENGSKKKAKRRRVHLNISTVKFHMLGHYAPDIRMFGPTDLYSTEWVSRAENFRMPGLIDNVS